MPSPPRSPGIRVLVLDDDELICRLLARSLERRGFTVVSETVPGKALARLATEVFDVVVSDVNMGDLDGGAFTERVTALGLDLPVILITGTASLEETINSVRVGAWDFLAKPIDLNQLVRSIERAHAHRAREAGPRLTAAVDS